METTAGAFVFPYLCFSVESETCFAHVGVFRILAHLLAPQSVCMSCVLTCMLACAWPASMHAAPLLGCPALGHSQASPTTGTGRHS